MAASNLSARREMTLAVITLCVAMSCRSGDALMRRAAVLKRGESSARALQLLGAPADRQAEDDDEVLQYCEPVVGDSGAYVVVWVYKGAVAGVTSYHRALPGRSSCTSRFKAIHWEDAPDRIIAPRSP